MVGPVGVNATGAMAQRRLVLREASQSGVGLPPALWVRRANSHAVVTAVHAGRQDRCAWKSLQKVVRNGVQFVLSPNFVRTLHITSSRRTISRFLRTLGGCGFPLVAQFQKMEEMTVLMAHERGLS